MKKQNFVFILALAFMGLQQLTAQNLDTSTFRFAAKAGLNISSLGGDNRYDYASKPGFHLGALAEIPFTDEIMLQPEALLSFQGNGAYYDNDINLFYLTLPLIAKYNVWDALYIEAGPQIGLLLSNNIDADTYNTVVDPDVNSFDIGLAIGAGYRLNQDFYFQIRFNPGFVNVVDDIKSKNRVFQLSACYFF